MRDEKIRVWITKYALSGGIFCVDAKIRHEVSPSMVSWGNKFSQYAHGIATLSTGRIRDARVVSGRGPHAHARPLAKARAGLVDA